MKVAVCLSGHLRKFTETYPSLFNNLIKKYDCDIFISTWDKMGYTCQYKQDINLNETAPYLSNIQQLYKPKKIIIESISFIEDLKKQGNEYAPHLINCPKHVGHMASMFYKIYAANELRKQFEMETGTTYDVVVRCRPDLIFNSAINISEKIQDGHILIPKVNCGPGWYSDQFAVSLPYDMDLYSSFFFNMPEYFRAKNEYYPEKFMDWSFRKAELVADFCDYNFHILR